MADEAPEHTDAQVIAFPAEDGTLTTVELGTLDAEGREKLRIEAARRKAVFVHRANGAQLRSTMLPRALLKAFADGTAVLLLAKVLNGEIEPANAKEAADVAKIAYEIARKEEANAPVEAVVAEVAFDRASTEDTARKLLADLRDRREQAEALPDAPFGEGPDLADEWEFETEVPDAGEPDGYDPDVPEPSVGE